MESQIGQDRATATRMQLTELCREVLKHFSDLNAPIDETTIQPPDLATFADGLEYVSSQIVHHLCANSVDPYSDIVKYDELNLNELEARHFDLNTLPAAWRDMSHPLHNYLSDLFEEERELKEFFDAYGTQISQRGFDTLISERSFDEIAQQRLRDTLDRAPLGKFAEHIEGALNFDSVIDSYRGETTVVIGKALYGHRWLLH